MLYMRMCIHKYIQQQRVFLHTHGNSYVWRDVKFVKSHFTNCTFIHKKILQPDELILRSGNEFPYPCVGHFEISLVGYFKLQGYWIVLVAWSLASVSAGKKKAFCFAVFYCDFHCKVVFFCVEFYVETFLGFLLKFKNIELWGKSFLRGNNI